MIVVDEARRLLADNGDVQRADENKKYFRSPYAFLGVSKKDINRIGGSLKRHLRTESREKLLKVLEDLWNSGIHEEMSLAIVLAALFVKKFYASDVGDTFSRWIDECYTWDHIDELCIRVTGVLVLNDLSMWRVIEKWSASNHMWKRRASLISHLPAIRAQGQSVEVLERTCRILASEQEFFIRKAIGWVLREFAEHDVDAMTLMFRRICGDLSNLSRREATRKLDETIRKSLLETGSS